MVCAIIYTWISAAGMGRRNEAFSFVGSNSSTLASAYVSWVVRATSCPDARSAQEAIALFVYGTESLPVAFGDPGNK